MKIKPCGRATRGKQQRRRNVSVNKKTGLDLLREPFPENQISQMCRSTKKDNAKGKCSKCHGWHGMPAVQLSYVGHAALTDRLLEADPSWAWEPLALAENGYPVVDKDGGMWIKLTVCGVTRLGYGDNQNRPGGDGTKERIGDALRNAAMRFGAALDLWHKGDLHESVAEEPEPPKKPKKQPLDTDFLTRMKKAKEIVGENDYYAALGGFGYEKANQVTKEDQAAVREELRHVAKLNKK